MVIHLQGMARESTDAGLRCVFLRFPGGPEGVAGISGTVVDPDLAVVVAVVVLVGVVGLAGVSRELSTVF